MGKVQIVKKNVKKEYLFCDLSVGDLFISEDKEVCLKITPIYTADEDYLTAICISNGYLCYNDDDDTVIPIRAVMTVEEE